LDQESICHASPKNHIKNDQGDFDGVWFCLNLR
jgi:hypothetical protein